MKTIKTLKTEVEAKNSSIYKVMQHKLLFIMVAVLLLAFNANGQAYLADVKFDNIKEEAVVDYLFKQMDNNIESFSDIKPSMEPNSSTDGFSFQEREYLLEGSLDKVWKHYVYTNPMKAWNTKKIDFGFMFSKKTNDMIYPNEDVEKFEPGQLIYVNLNFMNLKNIATAFEVTRIDREDGIIEFSYVHDNVTHGKQQLSFEPTDEGHTKIVHRSYFKSNSSFRDKVVYPYFHARLTNMFHDNMKSLYQ